MPNETRYLQTHGKTMRDSSWLAGPFKTTSQHSPSPQLLESASRREREKRRSSTSKTGSDRAKRVPGVLDVMYGAIIARINEGHKRTHKQGEVLFNIQEPEPLNVRQCVS